ncbi:glycosyltransferase family 2 protein [Larkinella bovis]|uniref:Glycosyltransferase family 2 protein n=1 Tax=Larkinella bovis TaxID=683041 RepID=A0ABW0IAR2_9BACT
MPTEFINRHAGKISIVVPAHNEEENLPVLVNRLGRILAPYPDVEILIIDDGSTDNTLDLLQRLSNLYPPVHYVSLARNFGHQAALRAGFDHATGSCVICLGADWQHPPELIPALIRQWEEGYDVVCAIRKPDPSLSLMNRQTSRWFYQFVRRVSGVNLEEGAADFRLLDRKVVENLRLYQQTDLFLRGMITWMGFRQSRVEYQPVRRDAGKSNDSFRKIFDLATMGVTSLTTKPLYLSVVLGFGMFLVGLLAGADVVYETYFTANTVFGWLILGLLITLLAGIQIIMVGVIAVYLGKAFQEIKHRPTYRIQESNLVRKVVSVGSWEW